MGLFSEQAANTAANAKALIAALEAKHFLYTVDEQSEERARVRISFIGDDLPLTLHFILRTDRQICMVYSPLPVTFPEECRTEAALAAAAANYGLIDGSFDLNPKNGTIRFRLTSSFLGTVLSEELFAYMISVSAQTVDQYNNRFAALADGEMTLEEFLAADAGDKGVT